MIAIIDDDTSMRLAVGSLARSYGFSVDAFRSAEDFLRNADFGRVSCVVTDIQMPGMNGLELHQQMIDCRLRIPFIFMTAFHGSNARDKAFSNGAVGFLLKPFSGAELMMQIELATGASSLSP
jgi:FixJ family two-component response regulator